MLSICDGAHDISKSKQYTAMEHLISSKPSRKPLEAVHTHVEALMPEDKCRCLNRKVAHLIGIHHFYRIWMLSS